MTYLWHCHNFIWIRLKDLTIGPNSWIRDLKLIDCKTFSWQLTDTTLSWQSREWSWLNIFIWGTVMAPSPRSVLSDNFFQIRQESDLKLSTIWQQLLLLQGQLMREFYRHWYLHNSDGLGGIIGLEYFVFAIFAKFMQANVLLIMSTRNKKNMFLLKFS